MGRITEVTLRRGACFGPCPIYDVTLRRRGWSSWRGERFTPRIGQYRGRVDEDEFDRLAEFIVRCGFFDWKAEYSPEEFEISDASETIIAASRGGDAKTVSQRGTEEPPDFWVLGALVDQVANQIEWVALTRKTG